MRRDSTGGRAHMRAAGAPPKKEAEPALGHSRGGFRPPIPILADKRGRPLRVTGGPRSDRPQARLLGEAWTGTPLACRIADRTWDGDAFRAWWAQQDIKAVLPAQSRRTNSQPCDPARAPGAPCRGTGSRLAQGVAPRGPGFPYLAAAWIGLKSYTNTT